jgi:ribonuclease R
MQKTSPLEAGISRVIKEFKLPIGFSKKVLEESRLPPAQIPSEEMSRRIDLRGETIVTIDGENARDFDDAVSVTESPAGGFLLKVSIADVSYYVRPGSAIDQEAYRRGTSTYFPDRVIPMLPERLSNDLCSLVPHRDRLTFTAEMEFDREGRRRSSRFYRSVIRSAARLTYTEVRKILVDRDPETISKHKSIVADLERMGRLADKIQEVRRERGSLDFDLPEPLIELDLEEGKIDKIVKAERNKAHRLIEEFMIAANEAVAEFITEKRRPMIYRVHGEPDPEKARDFALMLHNLGYSFRVGKKVRPKTFAAIIETVRGRPEERLLNTVLLRTMKQAVYDTRNAGHFGLASECYTHFTSPIRRYPDLMVHRILADTHHKNLHQIAVHCSERERNSMKAEWASRDLTAAIFMKERVGQSFPGIVSNVTKFGFFVELIPFFVEGLVSLRNLKDDFYVFHEKSHLLAGKRLKKKYQIGTPVTVRVKGVNLDKRWVDFELDRKSE